MLTVLALLCLLAALLPAGLAVANLLVLRSPEPEPGDDLVSILIPARNEAGNIAGTVRAALASTGVPVEVIVGDDHSTDDTAAIVTGLGDPRLRLAPVPDLPEGWTGKNHACAHLASQARGRRLLFIDADVTLEPQAAAALSAHARATGAALVSAVPRQRMDTLGERLTVPMINFLLVGYLPMPLMRRLPNPSLATACGQLVLFDGRPMPPPGATAPCGPSSTTACASRRSSGGRATAPISWRAPASPPAGCMTASPPPGRGSRRTPTRASPRPAPCPSGRRCSASATCCRFPRPRRAVRPAAAGGRVARRAGLALSLATRAAITVATREPAATILLHPASIAVALAIQWNVLLRRERAGAATWKGRSYPVGGA